MTAEKQPIGWCEWLER